MEARTLYLIKRVETETTIEMTKSLSVYDLTPLQYTVLSFVDTQGDNFSSAQLARRFLMTPQSMNETVTILQRKDMLDKTTDPSHKRILLLKLTDKGKEILIACDADMNTVEADLLDGLTSKELALFRDLMGKVLARKKA